MSTLEEVTRGVKIEGILSTTPVEIVDVKWQGDAAISVVYRDPAGRTGDALLFRNQESNLKILKGEASKRAFDADGDLFRLVSEAYRISLAHLFDPLLAVHTSLVDPLPHQITAVYGEMLVRQPLKFLLADDPGAGKTIMAGLLMKELMARGDLSRCLVVCPGGLAEQWQEEMANKFDLAFQIVTNDLIQADLTGNPFSTHNLVIGRLDHMSRNDEIRAKVAQTDWDLIVCDEAHKMSCPWYGGEAKPTKRWELGRMLGTKTRHLLLMTATPHNGKDEDFQSFLQLLDQDRFEGKARNGEHVDAGDLMRRLTKESLVKFDGTPLFPERKAYAPQYELTEDEWDLYNRVTAYVSTEMNRVDRLIRAGQGKRGAIVGFAMTILQRRLASSPEAIYQSLRRRRENLERELEIAKAGGKLESEVHGVNPEDVLDLGEGNDDEYSDGEIEQVETEVVAHVTAAETIQELDGEIQTLRGLEDQAQKIRSTANHGKWNELAGILKDQPELFDASGHRRKLIIFTEHRDTLNYLATKIRSLIGKAEAVVTIHGGMRREDRRYAQKSFVQDKDVLILVATDAAGEGVNLQRAHLMINYDLPWNPNRLEQRFGRIHRIGQTEVCHMWNLVAKGTREGEVFKRLFEKLEAERKALGGRVFDVLGRAIEAKELRDLLMEAIRYGDRPDVRERLYRVLDERLDTKHLQELLEERALANDTMDASKIRKIKEDMERAEARRLQPYFIETFFLKAFRELGGSIHQREPRRYEITNVPAVVRNRGDALARGYRLQTKYERVTFEKDLIQVQGKPTAEFVCPGHLLLDATIDLVIEQNRNVMQRGSILIDPDDVGTEPRALWFLQGEILDARQDSHGNPFVVSRQMHFVEMTSKGEFTNAGFAPYLDYRPLSKNEQDSIAKSLMPTWTSSMSEDRAIEYASSRILPSFFEEVRLRREMIVEKTKNAVQERLTQEIFYWDRRANELKEQELKGKKTSLSSGNARRRADDLEARRKARMDELERERHIILRNPVVIGGAIIIPQGLLDKAFGHVAKPSDFAKDRDRVEQLAMDTVMSIERSLGREPKDVSAERIGYDIESRDPSTGRLYFIEVKGRTVGAESVTISKNEILTGLNMPASFILALVAVGESDVPNTRYVERPFHKEPDFDATSVNYDLPKLISSGYEPSLLTTREPKSENRMSDQSAPR